MKDKKYKSMQKKKNENMVNYFNWVFFMLLYYVFILLTLLFHYIIKPPNKIQPNVEHSQNFVQWLYHVSLGNWNLSFNSRVKLDQKMMPPPKYAPIKKRRSRRAQDFGSSRNHQAASQPTTPLLQGKVSRSSQSMHRRPTSTTVISSVAPKSQQNDSDSDTACGFDSAWRGSAQL